MEFNFSELEQKIEIDIDKDCDLEAAKELMRFIANKLDSEAFDFGMIDLIAIYFAQLYISENGSKVDSFDDIFDLPTRLKALSLLQQKYNNGEI
jgi:hypothetical protein